VKNDIFLTRGEIYVSPIIFASMPSAKKKKIILMINPFISRLKHTPMRKREKKIPPK
jgi:hypothetical protein